MAEVSHFSVGLRVLPALRLDASTAAIEAQPWRSHHLDRFFCNQDYGDISGGKGGIPTNLLIY